jgi:hypothetical protein
MENDLATEKQRNVLYKIMPRERWGRIPMMTKKEAHTMISTHAEMGPGSWNTDLRVPTDKQEAFLRRHGRWRHGLSRRDACALIGNIIARAQEDANRTSEQR